VIRALSLCLALSCLAPAARADVFRPAYLELREVDAQTYDVLWRVPAQAENVRLGIAVRLPDGCETLGEPRGAYHAGAWTERWRARRPGGLVGQTIRIDGLAGLANDVIARVERADGSSQVERLGPARPSFTVTAPAGALEVARAYLVLGVEHILGGFDHLLFVTALLLIVRGVRRVIATITAFTVAHSITLAAATLGFVHVPGPPVEAAIALSIVFVAAEIAHGLQGRPGVTARAPWLVAGSFGLLHGLGFAGALAEVGLPERAIPLALFFFNVGVELGQLLFVGALSLAGAALARLGVSWPRWAESLPAYAIGALASFWVIERIADFWGR
jgi:hydrogenase/urease accessory protein HupE